MRIGVLEDDVVISELYQLWFSAAQHQCLFYTTIASFHLALRTEVFDLLLIDMLLPDGSGDMILPWVRENLGWDLPVIFVTSCEAEADIVATLRLGADDYVVKPPRNFELLARIEALGRRNKLAQQTVLKLGVYEINKSNREISVSGELVEMTQKEYELACYLFQNPGRLLSRVHLLEAIWGLHADVDTRTIDTHVSRLRRKLKIYPENGWQIISVYGYGYRVEVVAKSHHDVGQAGLAQIG